MLSCKPILLLYIYCYELFNILPLPYFWGLLYYIINTALYLVSSFLLLLLYCADMEL